LERSHFDPVRNFYDYSAMLEYIGLNLLNRRSLSP
jgi:hypothetical protein